MDACGRACHPAASCHAAWERHEADPRPHTALLARCGSDLVGDLVAGQALVGVEGDVLAVEDREARAAPVAQALDEEEVVLLDRRAAHGAALVRLDHLLQVVGEGADVGHVVHGVPLPQVARELQGAPQHLADGEPVAAPAARALLRPRAVAMRLGGHVGEVDAQAVHVAAAPLVPLRAVLALVAAQRGAQALAAGHGALLRGLDVRGRLEAVLVDDVEDAVVGPVVELPRRRLLAVLLPQVAAVLLVQSGEDCVLHGVDRDDAGGAVVEGRGALEARGDVVALGAVERDGDQPEASALRGPLRVLAPAGVREAEVLAAAVARDPARALLPGRAVRVLDAEGAPHASLREGLLVQSVHLRTTELLRQLDMRLLVAAAGDLHPHALLDTRLCREETPDVLLELLVGDVGVEVTHPEGVGARLAHVAGPVRWHGLARRLRLGAPRGKAQDPQELGGAGRRGGLRGELHDEGGQDLVRPGNDVVGLLGNPDVVAVAVLPRGRGNAQAQAAHQHVLPAAAVGLGNGRALGKVLA
mmetsp:Transcript_81161/g.241830  ORF Transcript_81161/g.241830 Transcript_81161/m.241830 type:complete len:530 (-) Transcript_81161:453-2042(-)